MLTNPPTDQAEDSLRPVSCFSSKSWLRSAISSPGLVKAGAAGVEGPGPGPSGAAPPLGKGRVRQDQGTAWSFPRSLNIRIYNMQYVVTWFSRLVAGKQASTQTGGVPSIKIIQNGRCTPFHNMLLHGIAAFVRLTASAASRNCPSPAASPQSSSVGAPRLPASCAAPAGPAVAPGWELVQIGALERELRLGCMEP